MLKKLRMVKLKYRKYNEVSIMRVHNISLELRVKKKLLHSPSRLFF
jgi:hypothetical protein